MTLNNFQKVQMPSFFVLAPQYRRSRKTIGHPSPTIDSYNQSIRLNAFGAVPIGGGEGVF